MRSHRRNFLPSPRPECWLWQCAGKEGPVRPRSHTKRDGGVDPDGVALRSLWGAEELDAVAITPEFAPGDVVVVDSWCAVSRTRSVFSPPKRRQAGLNAAWGSAQAAAPC